VSSGQFRDEPRTYAEIAKETVARNSHFFWLGIALFFAFISFLFTAVLIHIHITEVSLIAASEKQADRAVTENPLGGYYLSFVIYTAMCIASSYQYLQSRRTKESGESQRSPFEDLRLILIWLVILGLSVLSMILY